MLKEKHFYEFEDFRVEPEERVLVRGGKRLPLSGKAFDVLVMLLKHHGRLVRRDQIILEVWPDTHVGEGNLNVHITTIRRILGNDYIEAVPKQGYRFIAKVIERTEEALEDQPSLAKSKRALWVLTAVFVVIIGTGLYAAFHVRARKAPPDAAVALYQRALEYERVGDDEQALTTLDQALALRPNDQAACIRAAFIAYELEEPLRAGEYLARCKAIDARDEAMRLKAQGLSETLADNSTRAMELYQLLIDRYPHDTDALYRFAQLATDKDRLDEAERSLRRCLADEPANRYCRFQMMYVKIKQNKFDDVLSDYKSLPASVRDYPWFDEPAGIALFGKDQLDDAKRMFERLSESQQRLHGTTHFTVAKEWLADLLLYQGRIKDATRRIQQIMETSDNASSRGAYLAYLAQIYALIGDSSQAAKFAKEVGTVPPEPTSLVKAALVLASLGDSSDAERLLKLRSEATHTPLSAANDHLIRGVLALTKGDINGGIDEIRLANDLNPRDEEVAYLLGMAYLRAGNYESALRMFRAVTDLKGTVLLDSVPLLIPLSTYQIAQCYEQIGNPDAAKPHYIELARRWSDADKDLRRRYLRAER